VHHLRQKKNSPIKLHLHHKQDIASEIAFIEKLYKKVYQPCETRQTPVITTNFYHANTIKEATEDLEQSSKGGSIAFKQKALFFKKANSIIS
jgi:hypothetical protein